MPASFYSNKNLETNHSNSDLNIILNAEGNEVTLWGIRVHQVMNAERDPNTGSPPISQIRRVLKDGEATITRGDLTVGSIRKLKDRYEVKLDVPNPTGDQPGLTAEFYYNGNYQLNFFNGSDVTNVSSNGSYRNIAINKEVKAGTDYTSVGDVAITYQRDPDGTKTGTRIERPGQAYTVNTDGTQRVITNHNTIEVYCPSPFAPSRRNFVESKGIKKVTKDTELPMRLPDFFKIEADFIRQVNRDFSGKGLPVIHVPNDAERLSSCGFPRDTARDLQLNLPNR